jgi:hypothetical protein
LETGTDFFSLKYGVAGVCVILCLLFLLKLVEIFFAMTAKRSEISDKALSANTLAVQEMSFLLKSLEQRLAFAEAALKKLDLDTRRFFAALKLTAGESWPEISERIQKDLLP